MRRRGALLDEGLGLARTIGYPFITAACLHHLGMIAADLEQDYDLARARFEEGLALYRTLNFPRFIGLVLTSLGEVARAEGDFGRAHALFRSGLATLADVGNDLDISGALDAYARLVLAEGRAARAARLAGAATRLRDGTGTQLWPVHQRARTRWLAQTRAALGQDAFAAAWTAGQAMGWQQAVAYALAEDEVSDQVMPDADVRRD